MIKHTGTAVSTFQARAFLPSFLLPEQRVGCRGIKQAINQSRSKPRLPVPVFEPLLCGTSIYQETLRVLQPLAGLISFIHIGMEKG